MRSVTLACAAVLSLSISGPGRAFNPPTDTSGPLTAEIGDPGEVEALEKALPVPLTLKNGGGSVVSGRIRISVTDDWRVDGKAEANFSVPGNGTVTVPFSVVAGKGTYAALYPVHARVEFKDSAGVSYQVHPILILSVSPKALQGESSDAPVIRVPASGPLRLEELAGSSQVTIVQDKLPAAVKGVGWRGGDAESGGAFSVGDAERGGRRRAFNIHPPYRKRPGELWVDYRLALPATRPIRLTFSTAIRDHDPGKEGASDGVDFRVEVGEGGKFSKVFGRFSAAKQWEAAEVDLSTHAGREVTLRFATGPGPARNTSCDASFWAEPMIWVGATPPTEARDAREARRKGALAAARAALGGKGGEWAWVVEGGCGKFGAAVRPGPGGVTDAFIVLSDGGRDLVFEGFGVKIGGTPVGGLAGLPIAKAATKSDSGVGEIRHDVAVGERTQTVLAKVWAEKGALRVAFSMPGVERDGRGEPRFTELALGRGSESVRRVYAGFGNVIEGPEAEGFELRAGGFTLSTRHVGADYANGLSLVQATDVYPDLLRVEPRDMRCSLVTHHDATFSLVPSAGGAFAAARQYRAIAGFRPGGGVAGLLGKMCLDQWGGDYSDAATGLEQVARYGVTNAVFVKHVWQRWGYDYRLPEIYPPAGDFPAFLAMADACKRAGILFAPHDNYIDFYPDAEGYSYDHIIFNPDRTPQKAWFNKGRKAQSYRWLPTAFFPWMEANLKKVKEGIAPTSYFVDVFSAMPPVDFYDRAGRFFPKAVCQERWGAAFDRIREVLGDGAPMISEAGHDALIGHLDGGQADHNGWEPESTKWGWRIKASDGERVPWHDMASHGAFVLFAGGLGTRYAGEGNDLFLHGYGSDDYLSMTVLGGRNPMCDGPFSRRAVMTYWLLQDVCAGLTRAEMLSHEFAGDDIHRQTVRFAGGATVHANRGKADWVVDGATLPPYGFLARCGGAEASVARRDGVICGFARAPSAVFVDARPPVEEVSPVASARVLGLDDLGRGRFRLQMEWEVLGPIDKGARPFAHFDAVGGDGEPIAFQGAVGINASQLARVGKHRVACTASLPAGQRLPAEFLLRCGLYVPGPGGDRLKMAGPNDGGGRARCGKVTAVEGKKAGEITIQWEEEADPLFASREARINRRRKVVDFGPVATDGAFRMEFGGPEWRLIPLPQSDACVVRLRPGAFGAARGSGHKVTVRAFDAAGKALDPPMVKVEEQEIRFETAPGAFEYRIGMGG